MKKNRELRAEPPKRITCIRYTSTWSCNSRCTSCHIWEMKPNRKQELTPGDIEKLCKNNLLKDVTEVVFSGGEPTLRDDLPELVLAFHRNLKKAKIAITINGTNPDRAYKLFKKIKDEEPDFRWDLIGVSLNGPKDIHEESRGLKNCFEKAVKTADLLNKLNNGNVDYSFTFTKKNVEYFDWVKEFGKKRDIGTHICWTVMNDRFKTNKDDLVFNNDPSLIPILEGYAGVAGIVFTDNIDKDFNIYRRDIKRAYLFDSILNKRVMPCHACKTFFHLAPNGDVYPCNFKLSDDRIIGNIKDESLDEIWRKIPKRLFDEIKRGDCMFPNGVCGDSDLTRSISQVDVPTYKWFKMKRDNNEELITMK